MDNGKSRHTIWLPNHLWEKIKSSYREDNCSTQNEFAEKALEYYIGHLHAEPSQSFLPQAIPAALADHLGSFGDRIGSLLFKLAVKQNLANNLLAADMELDVAAESLCCYPSKRHRQTVEAGSVSRVPKLQG